MRSKAVIGNHPIHPALVPLPIGAFFVALVGDVMHAISPEDPFWYDLAFAAIGIGLITAIAAATAGAVDYLGVKMSAAAARLATIHAAVNGTALVLYAVRFMLRRNRVAQTGPAGPWPWDSPGPPSSCSPSSGRIGGKLAFEHRIGVIEGEEKPRSASPAMRPARRA